MLKVNSIVTKLYSLTFIKLNWRINQPQYPHQYQDFQEQCCGCASVHIRKLKDDCRTKARSVSEFSGQKQSLMKSLVAEPV